jgi:hypothetical protein
MTRTTTGVSGTARMTPAEATACVAATATPAAMTATTTMLGQRGRANSHQEPQ